MIWGVVLLLVAALIGIPLSVALTGTTAALGAVAGLLALLSVHTRSAAGLTVAVACGLLQELAALVQAGQPPTLWSAVLLGSVVYLLLDVGAFAAGALPRCCGGRTRVAHAGHVLGRHSGAVRAHYPRCRTSRCCQRAAVYWAAGAAPWARCDRRRRGDRSRVWGYPCLAPRG